MERTDIDKLSRLYGIQGITLAIITLLACLIAQRLWQIDGLPTAATVSLGYMLLVVASEAMVWRWVAASHSDSLPTYFTAVSGFRLLLALAIMFIYYLSVEQGAMLKFFMVFMIFYVVQLVHHSIFFAKVSNRS